MRVRHGFTLVELLVVIAIFAVVATAIAASLAGGIRAWDAARDFSAVETDALIDLQIMQRDIANTFRFHGIGFLGSKTTVSFPALVYPEDHEYSYGGREEAHGDVRRIGTVRYLYSKDKQSLFRKAWTYPGSEKDAEEPGEDVIGNLKGVSFEYYRLAPEPGQPGTWVGSWDDDTNFPARIRIQLMFGQDARPAGITRTVVLPTVGREADK